MYAVAEVLQPAPGAIGRHGFDGHLEPDQHGELGLGSTVLPTISVCDVDLVHQSHISDEEELRFQMGVSVYGLERGQHSGGTAWHWGERALHHRKGVHFRLVNVGASSAIERFARFG